MPEQLVVLIGSDGKRVAVSRSAATQASMVLRDLLDGKEPTTYVSHNSNIKLIGKSEDGINNNNNNNNHSIPAIELPFPYFTSDLLQRICAHMTYRYNYQSANSNNGMTSIGSGNNNNNNNNNNSSNNIDSFSTRNMMREIPRPMILPLNEYLDAYDRRFIEDWDEATTVLMVKAATLLNYEELLNLASARLAVFLSEKSVEGLRAFLGVESDFTLEEEAELKKEYERIHEER